MGILDYRIDSLFKECKLFERQKAHHVLGSLSFLITRGTDCGRLVQNYNQFPVMRYGGAILLQELPHSLYRHQTSMGAKCCTYFPNCTIRVLLIHIMSGLAFGVPGH